MEAIERKLLTKAELARRYMVSTRTIDSWMAGGLLSFIKMSRKCVRFDPAESDLEIAKFKVDAKI
jgi:hypothetical protein